MERLLEVKDLASQPSCRQGTRIMPYHKLGEYKYQQLGREYPYSYLQEPTTEMIRAWNGYLL